MLDDTKSKSQKKREADAWHQLGVELTELTLAELDQLALSDILHKAIIDAKKISSFGAKKRQLMWIAKLIRKAEPTEIVQQVARLKEEKQGQTAQFHAVEQWRSRLIEEGKEAITELMMLYPTIDAQTLRHLIKQAKAEQQKEQSTGAARALFRYLREWIV